MNLRLDESVAANYKSTAQKIRVMSESWLLENIKSKKNLIGAKIVDGAYHTMIERITGNSNPQLFLMQYSATLSVTDLTLVPKFFLTPDIIERRKPLSSTARRAGWIGCNILYDKIPEQGKIDIVRGGKAFEVTQVVGQYTQIKTLQKKNLQVRGWLMDILHCVNNLSEVFTLQDVYKFAEKLKLKHAGNNNIEAKIRQQLQFLRDKGFLKFVGRGVYRRMI